MEEFDSYVYYLEDLLISLIDDPSNKQNLSNAKSAIDGQPAQELRRLVPLDTIRSNGAFFTSPQLVQVALKSMLNSISTDSMILDPCCGAGDLLIACANQLPVNPDLNKTLSLWGSRLIGRDLYSEFITTTQIRLCLSAILSSAPQKKNLFPEIKNVFPQIQARCGLTDHQAFSLASHIVINPPFTMFDAPSDCSWAKGKVNSAALFVEACILGAKAGTRIVAILPEVLRSGSRYQKWRGFVESHCRIQQITLYGLFDQHVDIDVFIFEGQVTSNNSNLKSNLWQFPIQNSKLQVSDLFDISVGPVVPHRDRYRGKWFPFIVSRNLPQWEKVIEIPQNRRYYGRTINPPFVVVRRTSRPGDKFRAVGTIIAGKRPVAVENHLLVLHPKDNSLKTCERLLNNLKEPATNNWLNARIRCRHLTVSSLAELPWWSMEQ